jgi:Putative Flp pilus-assembly TadE/G-like
MFVLALTAFIGFTAMAIDVGMLFQDRRHYQNSADAMALAGVAELPLNPSAATQKAQEWATNNGLDGTEIKTMEVRTTDFPNDTLYVEVEGDFNWIFGRVLGQTTDKVGAKAAAQVGSLAGGSDLMPWAIVMGDSACLDASGVQIPGANCSVKVGSGLGTTGWYGALDLDGNGGGSAEYESNIVDGTSDTAYCAEGQTEPDCDTTVVDALSGNKVGGTGQGIDSRLQAQPTSGCDTDGDGTDDFSEVFAANPTGSASDYSVMCPDSPRLIIVPIVTLNGDPVQSVNIEGWALAYLDGYSCVGDGLLGLITANCSSGKGHWEVQVTMVDAVYSQAAGFIGAFNPFSAVTVRRLIE